MHEYRTVSKDRKDDIYIYGANIKGNIGFLNIIAV